MLPRLTPLTLAMGALFCTPALAGPERARSLFPEDIIELTLPRAPQAFAKPSVLTSEDGAIFYVITERGDLKSNQVVYALLAFRRETCGGACQPRQLWEARTDGNLPGISALQNLPRGEIQFVVNGEAKGGRVVRLSLNGRSVTTVVNSVHPILNAVASADGGSIAYIELLPGKRLLEGQTERSQGLRIETESLDAVLSNRGSGAATNTGRSGDRALIVHNLTNGRTYRTPLIGDYLEGTLSLSADGQAVAIIKRETGAPAANLRRTARLQLHWKTTEDDQFRTVFSDGVNSQAPVWSGRGRALFFTSTDKQKRRGLWRFDADRHVLAPATETDDRIKTAPDTDTVVLERKDMGLSVLRRNTDGSVTMDKVTPVQEPFAVVEDVNQSPAVGVWAQEKGAYRTIYHFNPATVRDPLNAVVLRQVSFEGHAYTYGVYVPRSPKPPGGYPLLIQTHGFDSKTFQPEGLSTAGYAGQVLASRGILIVQLPDPNLGPPDVEGERATAFYDSVIDDLRQAGLVDAERMGILAWSRTGYSVRYAIAHSRYAFKAAVISDAFGGGYMSWLTAQNVSTAYQDLIVELNGLSAPLPPPSEKTVVAEGVMARVPVLLLAFGSASLLETWEDYVLRRKAGMDVQLGYWPDALHAPRRPLERLSVSRLVTAFLTDRLLKEPLKSGEGEITVRPGAATTSSDQSTPQ